MSEHTASTRHLLDITVTVPGDDGIDPEYLVDVLMWGLEKHNDAVKKFEESAGSDLFDADERDHEIQPLVLSITPDIGLGAEEAMVQDALNPSDPMEMPLADCVLVVGNTRKSF